MVPCIPPGQGCYTCIPIPAGFVGLWRARAEKGGPETPPPLYTPSSGWAGQPGGPMHFSGGTEGPSVDTNTAAESIGPGGCVDGTVHSDSRGYCSGRTCCACLAAARPQRTNCVPATACGCPDRAIRSWCRWPGGVVSGPATGAIAPGPGDGTMYAPTTGVVHMHTNPGRVRGVVARMG